MPAAGTSIPTPWSPPARSRAAVRAAGCGLAAVDALDRGDADAAFVVARPPGHHATATRGQGFCLFNNVAIVGSRAWSRAANGC